MENIIEKYVFHLILIIVFGTCVAFTIGILRPFFDKRDLLNIANIVIVFWTGIVLVVYTYETMKLREESQKQVKETQKQIEIQQRPFVVIEPILDRFGVKFESFKIRNLGNNPAINITIGPREKIKGNCLIPFLLSNCNIDGGVIYTESFSEKRSDYLSNKQEEIFSTFKDSDKYIIVLGRDTIGSSISLTIKYRNVENIEYYTMQKLDLRNVEIICSEKVVV